MHMSERDPASLLLAPKSSTVPIYLAYLTWRGTRTSSPFQRQTQPLPSSRHGQREVTSAIRVPSPVATLLDERAPPGPGELNISRTSFAASLMTFRCHLTKTSKEAKGLLASPRIERKRIQIRVSPCFSLLRVGIGRPRQRKDLVRPTTAIVIEFRHGQ